MGRERGGAGGGTGRIYRRRPFPTAALAPFRVEPSPVIFLPSVPSDPSQECTAVRHRLPIALLAAALSLAAAAPAAAQLRVDINIPANRLQVLDGDSVIRSYRVSVGLPGNDTPDGEFFIERAEWNPSWRPPPGREWTRGREFTPPGPNNPMGRVKLFFEPLYYIHGTPDSASIGQPASRGCVRMLNRDVVELARLLHRHARPTVAPRRSTASSAARRETRWSTFRAPVPLTIRYQPVVLEGETLRFYPDVYDRQRVHTEAVIQALLSAGYDHRSVDRDEIRAVLRRAAAANGATGPRLRCVSGLRRVAAG
jgi:lipoprotein-anchoring transpeptidase ErfK/SrfK